jgi:hypothetical protein
MHNTHTHASTFHVLRVIITWLVTCDDARSRRGMVCLMSSLFLSCVFLLVNSTTPRLPRQPRLVARRKVPGGGSWNLGRSNLRRTGSFNIYIGDVLYTEVLERFIRLSENWLTFCAAVSPPCRPFVRRAADRGRAVSPNRRWWSETCTGAGEPGFWKVRSHDRSRSSFRVFFIDDFFIYTCTGSTVSRSPSCSWYNGDLMDRSVVYLSHLCCFLWSDLDLCSTSVVHVNC